MIIIIYRKKQVKFLECPSSPLCVHNFVRGKSIGSGNIYSSCVLQRWTDSVGLGRHKTQKLQTVTNGCQSTSKAATQLIIQDNGYLLCGPSIRNFLMSTVAKEKKKSFKILILCWGEFKKQEVKLYIYS